MLTLLDVCVPLVMIGLILVPVIPAIRGKVSVESAAFRMKLHIAMFFASCLGVFLFATVTHAEGTTDTAFVGSIAQGMGFLAAAIAVGCSALGAGIAVAYAAPAAIGAISEKSENFGKAMIFVALAEGVAIYGLLVAILLIQKL